MNDRRYNEEGSSKHPREIQAEKKQDTLKCEPSFHSQSFEIKKTELIGQSIGRVPSHVSAFPDERHIGCIK